MKRELIGMGLATGLLTTLTFVACRDARTPAPRPIASASATATSSTSLTPSPVVQPTAAPSAAGDPLETAVAAAKSCDTPTSRWTNRPDGGVVFVNAWHRKDAGNIDRLEGVVGTLGAASDQFRCCFDAWASAQTPGANGKLMLTLELSKDGAVHAAAVDAKRTDIDDPVTRGCVTSVAKDLTFPKSPSDAETLVEFPFVVQAP